MKLEFKTKTNPAMPMGKAKYDSRDEERLSDSESKSDERKHFLPKDESCNEFFGVRSYLHNFYESVSIRNPQLYEDIYEDEMLYLNEAKKQKKAALICWKVNMALGALTLTFGVIFILVGYVTPLHQGIAGHNQDFVLIDTDAAKFNYYIKLCRIIGLVLFCVGGCIFCFTLLLSFFFNVQCNEDDDGPIEQLSCVNTENFPEKLNEKKIPATEELKSVQPKREGEEVVMTNSGFCKPPALKANAPN